jgi:hypothetical protein
LNRIQRISPAIIEEDQAVVIATQWAMRFYDDAFLDIKNCEFRVAPIRFWLVTFTRLESKKKVYAVVLPDGTIVEPRTMERS